MDEFDQAETCCEADDGYEVSCRLFATDRYALELLEAPETLFDTRAGLVQRLGEEGGFILFVGLVRDDATACGSTIGLARLGHRLISS